LRLKCKEYFESKEFTANLMNSRSNLENKLLFIKYIDIAQSLCVRSPVRWKNWRLGKD
jgi:hypothetical protein